MQRWIATHNIDRFAAMLAETTDPERRRLLEQLLVDERRKLAALDALPKADVAGIPTSPSISGPQT